MPFFISILEGPSPSRADPIIAISDPMLVEIIGEEISKRMANMAPYRLHRSLGKTASQALRQPKEEEWENNHNPKKDQLEGNKDE